VDVPRQNLVCDRDPAEVSPNPSSSAISLPIASNHILTVHIRLEDGASLEERSAIHAVNVAAFGGPYEADLVDQLRLDGHALISLVAEHSARIIGHILFSRMWIQTPTGLLPAVALAPLAVLPEHQNRGIGGRLIQRGLELLRAQGEKIVIVAGHPAYYPRFGFSVDQANALESPFPKDAFMALELSPGALDGIGGAVVYPTAFGI
jgi:putative acetyltransferase